MPTFICVLSNAEKHKRNFSDETVYKWLEALAWELGNGPDTDVQGMAEDVIGLVAAAQQPDGYLNSYYTVVEPDQRWSDLDHGHELYCAGHLFQAAIAFQRALGDTRLLDVARRLANHIDTVFGPGKRQGARFDGEAFGEPYELPSDQCYCETCAAIGSLMWNWRPLLISGESRYADLIERTLYNGILSSPGIDGQHYFYVNPLLMRNSGQIMEPELIAPNPRIDTVRGCLAIQRGPLVYCLEDHDQPADMSLLDIRIDPDQPLQADWSATLFGGTTIVSARGYALDLDEWDRALYRTSFGRPMGRK